MDMSTPVDARRCLPGVDMLLSHPALQEAREHHGHRLVRRAVRQTLDQARQYLVEASAAIPSHDALANSALARLTELSRPAGQAVFNLTGTVIHTNLGRAPLAEAAIQAIGEAARHP